MTEWWWFLVLNVVIAATAVLSSRDRPASPRRGTGVTRRASSVVLQRLRSFFIFSFPSSCLPFLQPDATVTAAFYQETEKPAPAEASRRPSPTKTASTPRSLALTRPPAPAADDEMEEGDPDVMGMDDVYALVMAGRQRPEPEREEEARRSDVDVKAEFIRWFKEQRLNSMFNYTQMLKKRALGAGRRLPAARPDQL